MRIFSLWVPKIPSDLLCPAMLIWPHPTLHVNFFLAKATKHRSVIDKTAAKLKTLSEIVVCRRVSEWGWGFVES